MLGALLSGCLGLFQEEPLPPSGRRSVDVEPESISRSARNPRRSQPTEPYDSDSSLDAATADASPARGTGDAAIGDELEAVGGETRVILSGEIVNARDLGGTPAGAGATVSYGALFRGPPLANLSTAGCKEFDRLGIRTVIDLRIAAERDTKPQAPCVSNSARIVNAPLPVPYNVSPTDYIADLNTTDSIARAFDLLGDASNYPIYFHCTWGRDRTAVLAAVILRALGSSRAAIQREYQISAETVGAYPRSLDAVLDELERRGGVDAYLVDAGVSAAQVATLRARLVGRVQP